ncbi:ciliary neurotrophic factor-like isoform X1 [Mobula hypostoma]|uniref:ciliary neurotrophic factor-like isoform X1 n=2 Tax=Mobula hypostoma TaxID=723540 RepID=UPI002FC2D7DC
MTRSRFRNSLRRRRESGQVYGLWSRNYDTDTLSLSDTHTRGCRRDWISSHHCPLHTQTPNPFPRRCRTESRRGGGVRSTMAGEVALGAPPVRKSSLLENIRGCIRLSKELRKRADETRRIYDRCQGLTEKMTSSMRPADASDGIPRAGTSGWGEMPTPERLSQTLQAYRRFAELLGLAAGAGGGSGACPRSAELRRALLGLRTDCEGLLARTGLLAAQLGLPVQASEAPGPPPASRGSSEFEAKLWGHRLLRELFNWALRSIRDFYKLRSQLGGSQPVAGAEVGHRRFWGPGLLLWPRQDGGLRRPHTT